MSNHLGNVLATVSDRKLGRDKYEDLDQDGEDDELSVGHYEALVSSAQAYYPFGMLMPDRSYSGRAGAIVMESDFEDLPISSSLANELTSGDFRWRSTQSSNPNLSIEDDFLEGDHYLRVNTDNSNSLKVFKQHLEAGKQYVMRFYFYAGPGLEVDLRLFRKVGGYVEFQKEENLVNGYNEISFTIPEDMDRYIRLNFSLSGTVANNAFLINDFTIREQCGYLFAFNGKPGDDEVNGKGNQYDYGFRIYNPRIAKFLSTDPLSREYPWYTPYQFAGNMPIQYIDRDGLEPSKAQLYWKKEPELKQDMVG